MPVSRCARFPASPSTSLATMACCWGSRRGGSTRSALPYAPWLTSSAEREPQGPSHAASGSLRRLRDDPDLRRQRSVYRAFVGDLHQPLALVGIEIALDADHAVDLVELALAR